MHEVKWPSLQGYTYRKTKQKDCTKTKKDKRELRATSGATSGGGSKIRSEVKRLMFRERKVGFREGERKVGFIENTAMRHRRGG